MTDLAQKSTEAIAIDPRSELMILALEIIPKIKHFNAQIQATLEAYGHDDQAILAYLDGFTINGEKDPCLKSWAKALQSIVENEQCDADCPLCDRDLRTNPINPRADLLAYFRVHHPRLKELAARVQADEKIFHAGRADDWEVIRETIDRYWEGVPDEERTAIWNFMECLN